MFTQSVFTHISFSIIGSSQLSFNAVERLDSIFSIAVTYHFPLPSFTRVLIQLHKLRSLLCADVKSIIEPHVSNILSRTMLRRTGSNGHPTRSSFPIIFSQTLVISYTFTTNRARSHYETSEQPRVLRESPVTTSIIGIYILGSRVSCIRLLRSYSTYAYSPRFIQYAVCRKRCSRRCLCISY